ncbi:MAG: asparagine synthase (glutamine-hydrolyzing) [Pontiellaceae bacterium]|nr:asparagine synthase (glutamine-hydrolyzing) [Pontiellaceae bacterium]MBN2784172.1 asparagine synthase (glutamine-hydrolyzing) [Pontiellaceae bacterium]
MCGIAGIFNWDVAAPIPFGELRRAADQMSLRGPDAEGFHKMPGVAFAHRRLTVIDLEGGWQPMVDRRTRVALVYNGEIYNFKSIRRELSNLGHAFGSKSDTEVLLRAYLQWGAACVDRLVGIFAFGIYDPRDERLLLVRDRMGAKPLYYAQTERGIVFASSVAALLHFDGVGLDVDPSALVHYFSSIRTTIGRHTLLESVKTLEPGTGLMARRDGCRSDIFRYWEFPVVPESEKQTVDFDEATEYVREMVCRSVDEQMVSDVPLGGFLSGGVDSTIIASVASGLGKFGAYNVGYGEHDCNEWPYVRMAADAFGISCREIRLEADGFVDTWKFIMQQKGLPLSTPNEVPIYHLAHALRQDYTVALSGEGADEVFGGYVSPYFSAFDFDRARRRPPAGQGDYTAIDRAMLRLYGQTHLRSHVEQHFLLNSWVSPPTINALLVPFVAAGLDGVFDYYHRLFDQFTGCSTLDKHMHLHARINLEGLLNRVDSSTMAASVEARVPFTDHRIAEFLYTLPDAYRMSLRDAASQAQASVMNAVEMDQRNLIESKRLLRAAFEADIPAEILHRRKVSFPVPFREWLGGSLHGFAVETLRGSELVGQVIREEALREMVAGADNPACGMVLWPLVNLALWEQGCHQSAQAPDPETWNENIGDECMGLVG